MPLPKIVTLRCFAETLALVQQITRETGEKQPGLLKRLVEADMTRLERKRTTLPDWNRR